ncbi:response regulator transcription factor [Pelosinus fermentans]|uniref:Two component transcriptional regulator, AraC family n=1 Tax=Pelosinus fermentans JBW45 TaxID=1192197 RepID=I9NTR6_9FIRM|nr:response regulator [Pelosinus fermentans]AJQ27986.1 two component transcriptional regulator, AraC family [Pelosinus fermentans JBW45]
MLKVLIVDDDFTARSNFKTMIDWEKNGFELCGEAANGQNAIGMIKDNLPDIVITDMNMPILDGVALIKYIGSNFPDIKSVALSGYEDFQYVKESLKNGAVDYLLKHKLDDISLLKVLNAASDKISREHKLMKQIVQSREILRQNFIRKLVLGDICDMRVIKEKAKELELPIDHSPLMIVVIAIDDFKDIKKRFAEDKASGFISSLTDLTVEILADMGNAVMSEVDDGKFVIIFHFAVHSELFIHNHVSTTVRRIRESMKRYLNITSCISLGRLFYNIGEISRLYKEVDEMLSEKIITGKDQIFRESANLGNTIDFSNLDVKDEKQIMLAIKAGDIEKINQYLDNIFDRITEFRVSYKSIQMICIELIGIANRIARESALDIKELYNNNEIPYEEMKKHETIMDVKKWIGTIYQRLITLLLGNNMHGKYTEPTNKALEYLRKNYTNDVSLNQAAEYIGVNSSYLSRVFKEDYGMGFAEYLNSIRVKQAKYLIERTDVKLKEIVKQVGFNNYTYFFKVFKMVAGITPVEYKEKCKNHEPG